MSARWVVALIGAIAAVLSLAFALSVSERSDHGSPRAASLQFTEPAAEPEVMGLTASAVQPYGESNGQRRALVLGEERSLSCDTLQSLRITNAELREDLAALNDDVMLLKTRYADHVCKGLEARVQSLLDADLADLVGAYPVESDLRAAYQSLFYSLCRELQTDDLDVLRGVATDEKLRQIAGAYRACHDKRVGRPRVRRRFICDGDEGAMAEVYDLLYYGHDGRAGEVTSEVVGLSQASPQVVGLLSLERQENNALDQQVEEILGLEFSDG